MRDPDGLLEGLLQLLYPERCPACDAWIAGAGPGLCTVCAASLYELGAACEACGEPQAAARGTTCARCRAAPPPFRRLAAPYRYGGELATAVRRWKYGGAGGAGRPELGRPLGALLAPALDRAVEGGAIDLVVPVPLHPRRLRRRGFSQAVVLASAARRFSGRRPPPPWLPDALRRIRATAEQAGLSRAERLVNVRGAFAARPRSLPRLRGRRVLLIDDVVTTGATAAACAAALLAGGAVTVDVLALARAEA